MRIPFFSWLFLLPICTLFLNFGVFVVSHQCLGNQRFLLLELKNNLKFNSTMSTKLAKWDQSIDCCSWEGITCNEGHVIGLDLTNESISGGLDNSSSLFSLQHLQSLSLAFNDFNNSQIPSEFERLANMSYLNLSNAHFAGQIPIAISRLTRLVTLDLSTTTYYSLLKLENPNLNVLLHNLSKLVELYLDGVSISAQGYEWCQALSSSLPNLRVLSLSYCNLSGPFDSSLRNLQSLSFIRLSRNNFSAPVPEFFANFKNLTSLYFAGSGLNGEFPKKIFQVPTLQTLVLSYNELLEVSLPEFYPNGSLRTMMLEYTNASGSLPPSIGNLKMLSTVYLRGCNFIGSIPDSKIANLTQLVFLDLSYNKFSGSIPDSIASLTQLVFLDLSENNFSGSIPDSIASLTQLVFLDLLENNFSGSIPDSIASLTKLQYLILSYNNFSGSIPDSTFASLTQLVSLDLSENNFSGSIPNSIASLTKLQDLFLSYNNFSGSIPIFSMCKNLREVRLNNNHLSGQITSTQWEELLNLYSLNLMGNSLNGNIPVSLFSLPTLHKLDLSHNQFSGQLKEFSNVSSYQLKEIPDFLRKQSSLRYLDLSYNQIHGEIPISICNAIELEVLDLSNNSYFGTIPQCLIELSGKALVVLNLRTNNFNGTIPDAFPHNCRLQTLALNKNQLKGGLPKSLSNCIGLEVLDIGNNHIKGTFPFYLKNTSKLRILVLRSNKFYGPITHPKPNATWPMLQIIDVASNNFIGNLPIILLSTWMAMVDRAHETESMPSDLRTNVNSYYHQETVTVTIKGLEMELVKILTIFTTIDFSCNGFDGPIPEEIGELKALYILNLSHNAFTGQIPSSLGNLSKLESLDLSSNELSGKIPVQLADGLIFLSVLNLSFNHLVGQIPSNKQFATFSETSFKGNEGLCGFPLKSQCTYEKPRLPPPTHEDKHWNSGIEIEWNYISAELGLFLALESSLGLLCFGRDGGYVITNMLTTFFSRASPNCILK
ncbi:receptor-like protein 33 [Alnus glutinosa]|uniref:receptor-like protein 33 n=1 Tax=Alnus glutinosa TaxID=3517 RepID=UPI002D77C08A|nr:receptor-like protein 33 [Alnus glutinosa]